MERNTIIGESVRVCVRESESVWSVCMCVRKREWRWGWGIGEEKEEQMKLNSSKLAVIWKIQVRVTQATYAQPLCEPSGSDSLTHILHLWWNGHTHNIYKSTHTDTDTYTLTHSNGTNIGKWLTDACQSCQDGCDMKSSNDKHHHQPTQPPGRYQLMPKF